MQVPAIVGLHLEQKHDQNTMNKSHSHYRRWLGISILSLLASSQFVEAQFFTTTGFGDMIAGFRKTGGNKGTYELVVNIGNVTNFLAVPAGSTIPVTAYSTTQLGNAFPNLNNLQWSVFSTAQANSAWTNSFGVFPSSTIWYTLPATNTTTQSIPPTRLSHPNQGTLDQQILGVGNGATSISIALGATNVNNTTNLVREATALDGSSSTLDDYISDAGNPSVGDFGGQIITYTVENTTPASFSSAQRVDFYQSVAASQKLVGTFIDPITGTTNGPAYFVGYFILSPSGTMTFTRATATVTPPPAPVLTITRTNTTSYISFGTTNGATYNLIFTTLSGITSPRSAWTPIGSAITGNGSRTNFTDTTTDPGRFYSVTAH
jgi:hypothetical protein